MCDKLVYDLAQEVEGSPAVFVRKDWVNILDNQNQNYGNNQSVLDTSQLSNSNKYMSYREAYLSIPFIISLASTGTSVINVNGATTTLATAVFAPATAATSVDNAVGLKSWFGQIIHSFTLDYNGTTIIQQTPLVNMWNSFKLMTSLSYQDLLSQGPTIGFWPDQSDTFQFTQAGASGAQGGGTVVLPAISSVAGTGVTNNTNFILTPTVAGVFSPLKCGTGNEGLAIRQRWIAFDLAGPIGAQGTSATGITQTGVATFGNLYFNNTACNTLWKSYIYNKVNGVGAAGGILQIAVVATVYMKHVHSFFNMVPLLKGVFMKMTMNLNNTTTVFTAQSLAPIGGATAFQIMPSALTVSSVSNPLGGVNPLMIASGAFQQASTSGTTYPNANGGLALFQTGTAVTTVAVPSATLSYRLNISVGARCLDSTIAGYSNIYQTSPLSQSVYLYIPAYSFNPVFEQAYLSSPVKEIKYSDIYQYQVISVGTGQTFNNLVTNGIANIKSVLILPFYSSSTDSTGANTGLGVPGVPVWQSPFDPAGTGPTSPLCHITNFNVQISGQNAIYNMEKYSFEQYNNQLYGYNAVNGGLTDGLTSGLVSRYDFDNSYCYYYVDVSRMLPVEMTVPKSVQILGQNLSSRAVDLIVFVEYGVSISVDLLTGARV
jgi:hypothetical protein